MGVVTGEPVGAHSDVEVGDDLQLHVIRKGTGPPVILLHGFTGSAETWSALSKSLEAGYSTLSIDLAGHGKSSSPEESGRYALDRSADDLAHVLDALKVERAAVVGYSLGGRAALHFALRHPSRVAALVLESASPGIIDVSCRERRRVSDFALANMIEQDGVEAFVDYWEKLPIWNSQRSLPVEVQGALRAQRLANDARGLANSLRGAGAGAEADVTSALDTFSVPTLLIAGELDHKYVVASRLMAGSMLRARSAIVDGAGHTVHLERAEIFAGLVTTFLKEQPSASNEWR